MSKESIKIMADIIKTEMELEDNRIMFHNQKWNLPNQNDIFVSLSYVSQFPYMNKRHYEDRGVDGFFEVQTLNTRQTIGIDIFSRDNTARLRKEEILLALKSTYAQQQCEKYAVKIAELPTSFNDISVVEAAARLNRYNISIIIFASFTKEKIVEYYDNFSSETKRSL